MQKKYRRVLIFLYRFVQMDTVDKFYRDEKSAYCKCKHPETKNPAAIATGFF